MEPRQILRSGITASALAHLLCLVLVIFFAEVHPFGTVTAEPIAVDLVRPEEVAAPKPPDPELPPKEKEKAPDSHEIAPNLDLAPKPQSETKAATASSPPPAAKPSQAAPPPQKQAALTPPSSPSPAASAPTPAPPVSASSSLSTPGPAAASNPSLGFGGQQPAGQPQAPMPAAPVMPAYTPAQPDVTVKYHVMLGLPQSSPGDGFDAPASQKADVGKDSIAEFRQHLKTCSKLPQEIAPTDKVEIKLRVLMTPDGRLAAAPAVIGGSASIKGPLLFQSAVKALDACQPYAMLPADRYKEWKVLDLVFTPQDFAGAS